MTSAPTSGRRRALVSVLAISAAVVVYLATQLGALLTLSDWSWDAFRLFGAGDQLSYLAVTANVAQGEYASVEPFTQTGSIYYPHAYYALLGLIAQVSGLSPAAAWAVTGIVVQVLLVVVVGVACIVASGRAWTGVLAAGPFLLGVLATVQGHSWYIGLDSHAVLWGPHAVLFPLNGEAFGLSVAAAAITVMILLATRVRGRAARLVLGIAAATAIGALANVQTYSFLTAVYLVSYGVAAYGLLTARRWWLWAASGLLIVALFVAGPTLAGSASQLVTLMAGLTPALPGIVFVIIRSRGWAALGFAVAGLAASPSVLGTYLGLRAEDPFLVYRVASSKDLGVPLVTGVVSALPVLIPLLLLLAAGIHRGERLWIAYPIGAGAAWFLLASNDRWGANQEPYRMWIDAFMLVAVTILPLLIDVVRRYLSRGEDTLSVPAPFAVERRAPAAVSLRARRIVIAGIALVLIVAGLSALDWARFFNANRFTQMIALQSPREQAIGEAALAMPDDGSLLLVDPCINPLYLKGTTGLPIAWMNVGMAWPEAYQAVLDFIGARADGELDLDAAREADAGWLITDSSCEIDWADEYADHLEEVNESSSDGVVFTLWRVTP